ncbi:Ku protein [Solitalea sp. MAHUQ-68]|uniref:Non-homologous end joining protein Ku n=1 Tax=Solitalea agri TaxID=2953739 RepID=A0A9X2JCH0_9SPHI|nr:Ku protein [Solitalea agri]MCO4293048.1 Ku protein [Solitalea agri]
MWNGLISFGLVSIPIGLHSAISEKELEVHQLDSSDLARIKYKLINENTGKEVVREDVVKGYKYEDEYVVLDDDDFAEAAPEKSKVISIESFVDLKEVESIYFEQPYYALPDKKGIKAYSLLCNALAQTKKAGLARFVLKTQEHLCLIRALDNVLVVQCLRFPEEVRSTEELENEHIEITKKELDLAKQIIKEESTKFDFSQYHNTYIAALKKRIKEKATGKVAKKGKVIQMPVRKSQDDLMAQLMSSLSKDPKKVK